MDPSRPLVRFKKTFFISLYEGWSVSLCEQQPVDQCHLDKSTKKLNYFLILAGRCIIHLPDYGFKEPVRCH